MLFRTYSERDIDRFVKTTLLHSFKCAHTLHHRCKILSKAYVICEQLFSNMRAMGAPEPHECGNRNAECGTSQFAKLAVKYPSRLLCSAVKHSGHSDCCSSGFHHKDTKDAKAFNAKDIATKKHKSHKQCQTED